MLKISQISKAFKNRLSHANYNTNYNIRLLMSCKSYEELPFGTLFQMAEEKYESHDYEEAEYFYSLAYNKNPHDDILILCYTNLLKTTQKETQAQAILQKSIKQHPTGTYKRYFELAEIYEGVQSIKMFEMGIQVALQGLTNSFQPSAPQKQLRRDIAQAYAGIAEVCLTDLINQKQAQGKCKEAMQKGLKMDNVCIDIKLQIANYLMWKDDFEAARVELLQLHQWIMTNKEEYENEAVITTGKYLIEVEQFKKSMDLFQKLHEELSSELEVIYMLAFCCFNMHNYAQCEQYLEEYEQVRQNGEIVNEEIEDAVKEMKIQLSKKKKEHEQTGEGEEEEWMDVEDDEDIE